MLLSLMIYQETPNPSDEDNTKDDNGERTITESQLNEVLKEQRETIRSQVEKEIEAKYEDKLIPDEIAGIPWTDVEAILKQVAAKDDKEEDDESEKIKALRTKYESEMKIAQQEYDKVNEGLTELEGALKTERIDNAILNELNRRNVKTPQLLVGALKTNVILDEDQNPCVVNEKNEARMITKEIEDEAGNVRLKPVEMDIPDLIDEFFKEEENQHFLQPSPREGSGVGSTPPNSAKEASAAEYREELAESQKQGRPTPKLTKLWAERSSGRTKIAAVK